MFSDATDSTTDWTPDYHPPGDSTTGNYHKFADGWSINIIILGIFVTGYVNILKSCMLVHMLSRGTVVPLKQLQDKRNEEMQSSYR